MQQPRRSPATVGAALAGVGIIGIAALLPPPDARPSSVAGGATVGLTASAEMLQTGADPLSAGDPADSGVLFELFAPLLSLIESTYLASALVVEAFASLDPLQILLSLIQFPELAFIPPIVVIIDDIVGGNTAGTGDGSGGDGSGGGDGGDGSTAGLSTLSLDHMTDQLGSTIGPMLAELGSAPSTLVVDPGLDIGIP